MKFSGAANYTLSSTVTSGPGQRVNFPAGMFQAGVIPNVQITVSERFAPDSIGRFQVEARNITHTGFDFWAYRTELTETRRDIRFQIHWLAFQ
jgi:hypothetical protein